MVQIVNETRLAVAHFVARVAPPRHSLIAIVKATFDLVPGAECTLAEEQLPPGVEVFNDGDAEELSVRHDSDVAVFKPRAECFLAGTAHPPGGRAVPVLSVGLQIGAIAKKLAVIGDREWKRGFLGRTSSEPTPFSSMPLRLERCFGGPGYDPNPLGVGFEERDGRWALPNIEDPRALIDSPKSRPEPMSAFPIPRMFPSRLALAGTYDERWKETRWPDLPEDFDFAYFNAAPPDQRIEGWFSGAEELVLEHLHPRHPRLVSRLPGVVPRCFLDAVEIPLVLDTITVDADLMKVFCVWRGRTDVDDPHLAAARLFVVEERLGSPEPASSHKARILSRLAIEEAEEEIMPEPVDVPPLEIPIRSELAGEVKALLERGENLAGRDLTGADLSNVSFAKLDLTGVILTGARLSSAVLAGACLDGAVLAGATAHRADFSGASLRKADLTGMDAEGARFEGAVLDGATLEDGKLAGCSFVESSCKGAEMSRADFTKASFSRANLTEADLSSAQLQEAVFELAVLREASIEGAQATGADFGGADLAGVKGRECDLARARFSGANLEAARLQSVHVSGADFSGARAPFADLTGARGSEVSFAGCDLRSAKLTRAKMEKVSFEGANLFEASFEGAELQGADLRGASLFGAELLDAELEGARFEGADLERTKLAGRV